MANTVDEFLIIDQGKLDRFNGDLIDYRKIILNGSKKLPKVENIEKEIEPKIDKKQAKQIKTEILSLEKTLKRLNRKLSETQNLLNSPDSYNDSPELDLHDLLRDQVNLSSQIELNEQEWLELNEELEKSGF